MRRRNSPRVAWLPQTNANSLGVGTQVYQLFVQSVSGATGTSLTTEIPVVLDAQQDALDANSPSLSDIESSGYRLRRIVGKIWVQMAQTRTEDQNIGPASVICTAGLIVRRSNVDNGASLSANAPNAIDAGFIQNTGDPWVWRRSWILGNNNVNSVLAGVELEHLQNFPQQNWGSAYGGGIAEGPHIDQKTARIVSSEERLYLDLTTTILGEGGGGLTVPGTIACITDLRILGSLRTTSGNRRNASR